MVLMLPFHPILEIYSPKTMINTPTAISETHDKAKTRSIGKVPGNPNRPRKTRPLKPKRLQRPAWRHRERHLEKKREVSSIMNQSRLMRENFVKVCKASRTGSARWAENTAARQAKASWVIIKWASVEIETSRTTPLCQDLAPAREDLGKEGPVEAPVWDVALLMSLGCWPNQMRAIIIRQSIWISITISLQVGLLSIIVIKPISILYCMEQMR